MSKKKDIFGGGKSLFGVSTNADRVTSVMRELGPEVGIKAKRKFLRVAAYWLRDRQKEDAPEKTGATKGSIGAKEKTVGEKTSGGGYSDYSWWIGVRRDYKKLVPLRKIDERDRDTSRIVIDKKGNPSVEKRPYEYAWKVNKFSTNPSRGWFDKSVQKHRGKAFQIFYWGMTGLVKSTMAKAK